MKVLNVLTLFVVLVIFGVLIGYIYNEKQTEIKRVYNDVKETVVDTVKGEEKEGKAKTKSDIEKEVGYDAKKEKVQNEYVEGNRIIVYDEIDMYGIDYRITYGMLRYYRIMEGILLREEKLGSGIDKVQVILVDGNSRFGFEYTLDTVKGIEKTLGEGFFKEHVKTKGSDVVNNAEFFWMTEDVYDEVKKLYKTELNWDRYKEKYAY